MGKTMTREWWAAIGPSGKIYEIQEGAEHARPAMLPPCSNQDLPEWVRIGEVEPLKATVKRLQEAYLPGNWERLAEIKDALRRMTAKASSYSRLKLGFDTDDIEEARALLGEKD